MPSPSTADHATSPPRLDIPRDYNAAHDLVERNLRAGRADKAAYIDDQGSYTYGELAQRVDRCAAALTGLGLQREQRVMLCLLDTIDFPAAFLGAIKAGIVPVAGNTLLTTKDYDYMLRDSRAVALVVSAPLLPAFAPLLDALPDLKHVIVSGANGELAPDAALARRADWPPRRRSSRRRRRPATTPASGCIRRARPARRRAPSTSSRA